MSQSPAPVNVQVVLRCRPLNSSEKKTSERIILECSERNREVALYTSSYAAPGNKAKTTAANIAPSSSASATAKKVYTFDAVFGPDSSQEDVYQRVCYPMVQEVLQGYNCTVFAYGQTGTGKTFTMEGQRDSLDQVMQERNPQNAGIIPRAVKQIFTYLKSISDEYTVKVSHLEIYNECLTDLLSTIEGGADNLRIYDDPVKGNFVAGLEEVLVKNEEDIFNVLDTSAQRRRTAETLMNSMSSRSHSVFTVTIHIKQSTPEGEDLLKIGKLNLVDLAGSENIGRSGAMNQRAREAGNINQSLLTLGRVITALVEKRSYVPYRDSKLTRILQESLGGRNKTCIVATVGPAHSNFEETVSTLDYANRAKSIKNRPTINQMMTKRALLKEYSQEVDRLKEELAATRAKNGIYLPEHVYEELMATKQGQSEQIVVLQDRLTSLEGDLQDTKLILNQKQQLLASTQIQLTATQDQLQTTQLHLNHTQNQLNLKLKEIHEKNFVIDVYQKNESKLSRQAKELKNVLESSLQDVAQLQNKVDRKTHIEEHNISSLANFQHYMESQLQEMNHSTHSFSKNHETQNQLIFKMMRQFALNQQQLTIRSQDNLNGFSEHLRNSARDLKSSLQHYVNGVEQKSAGLEQDFHSFVTSCTTVAEQCHTEIQSAVLQLNSTMDSIQGIIGSWNEHSDRCFSLVKQFMDEFSSSHEKKLGDFRKQVEQERIVQQEQLQRSRDIFKKAQSTEEAYAIEIQKAVLNQVGQLMQSYVNNVRESNEKNIAEMKETFENVDQKLARSRQEMEECSCDLEENLKNLKKHHTKAQMESLAQAEEIMQQSSQCINEMRQGAIRINNTSETASSGLKEQLEQTNIIITNYHQQERKDAVNLCESTCTQTDQHLESNQKHSDVLLNQVTETQARLDVFIEKDLNKQLTDINQECEAYMVKQTQNHANIDDRIEKLLNVEIRVDESTSNTPPRKTWKYPREFVCTRPYALLIQSMHENMGSQADDDGIEERENNMMGFDNTSSSTSEDTTNLSDSLKDENMDEEKGIITAHHHSAESVSSLECDDKLEGEDEQQCSSNTDILNIDERVHNIRLNDDISYQVDPDKIEVDEDKENDEFLSNKSAKSVKPTKVMTKKTETTALRKPRATRATTKR